MTTFQLLETYQESSNPCHPTGNIWLIECGIWISNAVDNNRFIAWQITGWYVVTISKTWWYVRVYDLSSDVDTFECCRLNRNLSDVKLQLLFRNWIQFIRFYLKFDCYFFICINAAMNILFFFLSSILIFKFLITKWTSQWKTYRTDGSLLYAENRYRNNIGDTPTPTGLGFSA